ncbi:nucleotidyltransferase domain-containing protein [bacterium]|nr:nucleotidyltransferase domain-containing protein [bacterium]
MLKAFFTSKTKVKVLALFLTHPEEQFYVRQIERELKEPITAVRRELIKLEEVGFLNTFREGNLRYYRVNQKFPLYPELKNIILKTAGMGDLLRENLKKVGKIKQAFIYGSTALGEERKDSDIDLMIIGKVREDELNRLISQLEDRLAREINYSIFSPEEFRVRKLASDPFISHVLENKKVLLIGDEDEL